MNALKTLSQLVWGNKDSASLYKIPSGELYERQNVSVNPRKCIFKDSELVIRGSKIPFNYQLVVTKIIEEGEEELEDLDDDERVFLLGDEIRFTEVRVDGSKGFKWFDPIHSLEYEYMVDDRTVNQASIDTFVLAVARCAWERKNKRPHTEASDEDIQRMCNEVEDEQLEKLLESVKISDDEILKHAESSEQPVEGPDAEGYDVPQPQEQPHPSKRDGEEAEPSETLANIKLPTAPANMTDGDVIVSVLGELYMFDAASMEFVQVCKSEAALTVVCVSEYTYWMNIASDKNNYITQLIEPNMNAVFNNDHKSLIWNYYDENNVPFSFSLIAADDSHYDALHQGMTRAAYETLNQEPWGKISEASQDYLLDAYEEDFEMPPAPNTWSNDDEENEVESIDDNGESESESEEEEEEESEESDGDGESDIDEKIRRAQIPDTVKTGVREEDYEESDEEDEGSDDSESEVDSDGEGSYDGHDGGSGEGSGLEKNDLNSMLAVGYKHDRSFVVRGNKIGVFRNEDDDRVEFSTTINQIDDTHGRRFTPSNIMLHEQDSAMVLMDSARPNDLYKMDLEYGKVVEEWKVHEDIPTVTIAPNTKYGQMSSDKTLVGVSHNIIYRIDPRIGKGDLIVQGEMQSYATKSHFTSAATTDAGNIVVGSENGEIKLFDRVGVRAKTALPALGEPIIGVDVTSDGRYVVATCKTYLLLIDAKIHGDEKGRTGFQKGFPRAQKPVPKRLQLKPQHVVYMGAPVSFTPARFNQTPDGIGTEKTIVTSTGPFVITWNLRRVLGTGRGDAYHIKQYPDRVVADNFRFGRDNSIVVTLPNDVKAVKRSQLAKPTRESLMLRSPVKGSRDSIVNAPY